MWNLPIHANSDVSSDDSESSDSDDSSSDSSFEVMFVPKERAPTGKLGMKEAMGEDCFQVGGGGS